MNKLVFISHIHEERELAMLLQTTIETEFSGFVDVFVSSDGKSIGTGENFIKKIENGLIDCAAAIYLVSPKSVQRSWISFELGAVWVRSAINQRSGLPEIPAMPFCHSGTTPANLPTPLNNLNAIEAANRHSLQVAFQSLQKALGGKGDLRTNFQLLADQIGKIQARYTLGTEIIKAFEYIGMGKSDLIQTMKDNLHFQNLEISCGSRPQSQINPLREAVKTDVGQFVKIKVENPQVNFTDHGLMDVATLTVTVQPSQILEMIEDK